MKKFIKTLLIIVILVVFFNIVSHFTAPERKIFAFVNENISEITEIAEAHLDYDASIKEIKGVEVWGVQNGTHDIVEFFYSGKGIVPSSKYYGFYYSPDDVPAAFQNSNMDLFETAEDVWEWSDGTDNGGITKRIIPCWFYYEAWF